MDYMESPKLYWKANIFSVWAGTRLVEHSRRQKTTEDEDSRIQCLQLRSAFICVLRSGTCVLRSGFRVLRSAAFAFSCVRVQLCSRSAAFCVQDPAFCVQLRSRSPAFAFSCVLRSGSCVLRSGFCVLRSPAFAFSCVRVQAAFCQHSSNAPERWIVASS